MSVDLHWEALTSGPDGEGIAETVRAFLHEKFQQVTVSRVMTDLSRDTEMTRLIFIVRVTAWALGMAHHSQELFEPLQTCARRRSNIM